MNKVYLVASGKGGTGKTMFSVNLGATLALRGYSVVIVDMDMGLRNLDLYLGLENEVVYDAYDVMRGICSIKQALLSDARLPDLFIIGSSPERDNGDITPLHVNVLCKKLREHFDFVIIDSPPGLDDGLVLASAGADEAIIVTAPEYAALRDADTLDDELFKLGIRRRYAVLNKVEPDLMKSGYFPSISEITATMIPELIGVILYDDNIHISTNLGVPIVLKQSTYIRRNFEKIVSRLLGEEPDVQPKQPSFTQKTTASVPESTNPAVVREQNTLFSDEQQHTISTRNQQNSVSMQNQQGAMPIYGLQSRVSTLNQQSVTTKRNQQNVTLGYGQQNTMPAQSPHSAIPAQMQQNTMPEYGQQDMMPTRQRQTTVSKRGSDPTGNNKNIFSNTDSSENLNQSVGQVNIGNHYTDLAQIFNSNADPGKPEPSSGSSDSSNLSEDDQEEIFRFWW